MFIECNLEQPYSRIQNLIDANVAKRQTASVYLKQLVAIGVLSEVQRGKKTLPASQITAVNDD